jgi:hypothetical protein
MSQPIQTRCLDCGDLIRIIVMYCETTSLQHILATRDLGGRTERRVLTTMTELRAAFAVTCDREFRQCLTTVGRAN